AKSGYGLSLDDERKSLEAIGDAASHWPGTVVRTVLAAHVVPPEYARRREDYVTLICKVLLPEIADDRLADSADVFVERGAFSATEAEKIMGAARAQGLGVRLHVGQFTATTPGWIGAMAARFQIASLDHMDRVA